MDIKYNLISCKYYKWQDSEQRVCFAVVAACLGLYVVCAGNSSGIPEVEFFCKSHENTIL